MANVCIKLKLSFPYRARIAEQYDLELPRTRFLDTMALHIAVNGMTSGQRKVKMKEKAKQKKSEFNIVYLLVVYFINVQYVLFFLEKFLRD